ncbi:MAG: AAA family ATPase [Candidatus Methanospirareceae archaeon]
MKSSQSLGKFLRWLKLDERYEEIKMLEGAFEEMGCRLTEKPKEDALAEGVIFVEDTKLKVATRGSVTSHGYSKVAPLILGLTLSPKNSILCIEDPEIHLHPKSQALLADLIIKSVKEGGRQAIITTHSEHMLVRLVRRIADGTISPEDVAVYYLSKEEGGIEVEKVKIEKRGIVSDSFWKFFEEEIRDVFEIKFGGGDRYYFS